MFEGPAGILPVERWGHEENAEFVRTDNAEASGEQLVIYDSGMMIWVSDLDGYINIDAIERANKREEERDQLDHELHEIGDLQLLAGKKTSARQLNWNGVSPSDWRYAVHKAEMMFGTDSVDGPAQAGAHFESLESRFVRSMVDLGRSYAVARYARWEHLDFPSAVTATLPLGIRALINQFLSFEGALRSADSDNQIGNTLSKVEGARITAYGRTRLVQAALHRIADCTAGHPGGAAFNRHRTRAILALTRLHFSILELRLSSLQELRELLAMYAAERTAALSDQRRLTSNGRTIRAWRLRHVRPLLDLYPYAVRHGLERALASLPIAARPDGSAFPSGKGGAFSREALVNELALAQCGILQMRRAGRDGTKAA
ncbi:MAG: hypothetical protein ACK4SZ_03050 [Allosphingosinicella sp.]|uniref:hypothetical protein n=1 Tax=Allosphingosinicella sp. TaxID=2823234 RepID=UPI003920C4C6